MPICFDVSSACAGPGTEPRLGFTSGDPFKCVRAFCLCAYVLESVRTENTGFLFMRDNGIVLKVSVDVGRRAMLVSCLQRLQ